MFEFDKYEKKLHFEAPSSPTGNYTSADDVTGAAILIWGEHCIECAAPSCYQSCDLYASRPDLRCRRFSYGAFRNNNFHSFRGYGAEISFKKWGKIEARGNTALMPLNSVLLAEKFISAISPSLNAFGFLIYRITRDIRWRYATHVLLERLGRWLHRTRGDRSQPDVFLLEIYNPTSHPIQIQLAIGVAQNELDGDVDLSQIPQAFRTKVTLNPGYSKHQFEWILFKSITESGLPFDVSLGPEADSDAHLIFLAADFVRLVSGSARGNLARPKIKCVVFDLDNTLWDGVLAEGDHLEPNKKILELIHSLDQRGILISIASKNNFDDAWHYLEQLEIAHFFLFPQINWIAKSENIRSIAENLNIGLDTFAFIDDNPFELEQVSQTLASVTCVNVNEIDKIVDDPRFEGGAGDDARNRRQYYKDAIQREEQQRTQKLDVTTFLAACNIKLVVSAFRPTDFERVAELVQRTNQLNFSGQKYGRDALSTVIEDNSLEKYVLKCSDKYGSYGTVGFSLVRRCSNEIRIEDFMLSCRVQGKFIEQAFFNHLVVIHPTPKVSSLSVNFQPTQRNKPAQMTLESLRFQKCDEEDKGWVLDLTLHSLDCSFIDVES